MMDGHYYPLPKGATIAGVKLPEGCTGVTIYGNATLKPVAPTQFQVQLAEAWKQMMQPYVELFKRVGAALQEAFKTLIPALKRIGRALPRKRLPKKRSRLRSRVALKRAGLYQGSVWA